MHELSIARELVRLLEAEARRAGARRVRAARLVLGSRAHLSAEALQFYVTELVDPTGPAAGVVLEIEHCPMRFYCTHCQSAYEPAEADWRCPGCGQIGTLLAGGDEVLLESLEVECDPTPAD
ncbi:hydrogenase maturation nickel metallochaperone HypA [Rhodothermus bifroesti]|uniref:Hydrogenase maturation factor HypA n=1 Tax=Rhodothermus marinus TaxID=29549 RepID=A0A7V2B1K2_RHOMR|nr:hydrogenase maturation nickel metallochaperone HypA [Rhodothermus bifroesti]GBD01530.1 hydrogenase nickel incorporation protein HypA [bacterium HR18]